MPKIQLEATPENVRRVKEIVDLNNKLDRANNGQYVVETAEEEQQLIQAGDDYKQLINNFDLTGFIQ